MKLKEKVWWKLKEKYKLDLINMESQEFYEMLINEATDLTLAERNKEVGKEIDDEISILKDIHVEVDSQLDILRDDIRDNVESIDVGGKAFSRTSDIDNSIDAKEKEIKDYFKNRIEEFEQELKQKLGIK